MWEEFIETNERAEPTSRHNLEHYSITVRAVPVPASKDAECNPVEKEEDEGVEEVEASFYCEQCGRQVYESRFEHDESQSHMTRIGPRLFLGAAWNASNESELAHARIGTVVSVASEIARKPFPNSFRYKHFVLEDDETEFIIPTLVQCTAFLSDLLARPTKQTLDAKLSAGFEPDGVLVHCAMGRSRSVTCVAAYLMLERGLSAHDALETIHKLRPTAMPNVGYVRQLRALDVLLKNLPLDVISAICEFMSQNGYNV